MGSCFRQIARPHGARAGGARNCRSGAQPIQASRAVEEAAREAGRDGHASSHYVLPTPSRHRQNAPPAPRWRAADLRFAAHPLPNYRRAVSHNPEGPTATLNVFDNRGLNAVVLQFRAGPQATGPRPPRCGRCARPPRRRHRRKRCDATSSERWSALARGDGARSLA